MQTEMTIECVCGKEVTFELIGGQYQEEYRGDCECGRRWSLKELTEVLAENSDEGLKSF